MKRVALILILIVLVSWVVSITAQETPPPAETPTAQATETPLPSTMPPIATETLLPSATSTDIMPPTELPTSTEIFTSTPESTATPVETSTMTPTMFVSEIPVATEAFTPTPIPPIQFWTAVFSDSFSAPNTAWNFTDSGWAYVGQPDGTTRLVATSGMPAFYQGVLVADAAVEALVDVSSGTAHVYARHNGTVAYEARLTSRGEVILLRAGTALAATTLPNFAVNELHRVRFSVVGTSLWVDVDGLTQLSLIDPEPLPPGLVGLSASLDLPLEVITPVPPQQVAFVEFTLYQPAPQITPTPTLLPPPSPTALVASDVPTLRAILAAANTLPCAADSVIIDLVPNNLYTLNDAVDGENGFPLIQCQIVINGSDAIIERSSATDTPQFRFFTIGGGDLTLNHLTLRNGNSPGSGGAVQIGGYGRLTARFVIFHNNRIQATSGFALRGAAISGFYGVITVEDSSFIANVNEGNAAWEAANGGAIGLDSSPDLNRIIRSTFRNNRATDAGGAIFIGWSNIDIQDSLFEQNAAGHSGGAIYGITANVMVSRSQLVANDAPRGSAVHANYVSLRDSCITGNRGLSILTHLFDPGTVLAYDTWWGQPDGASGVGDGSGDSIGPDVFSLSHLDSPPSGCITTVPIIDSDDDWLNDEDEINFYATDPQRADMDDDGLSDGEEIYRRLDPSNPDMDTDGLLDGFEVLFSFTDSYTADTDGNGILDGDEDFDSDGLSNLEEQLIRTQPHHADTDGNSVTDGDEDYDSDGLTNLQELRLLDAQSAPLYDFTNADTDSDGILDGDEDVDDDGLTNHDEFVNATDPLNPDMDADELLDGFEVIFALTDPESIDTDANGTADADEDFDSDELSNLQEQSIHTDPRSTDTDADGVQDGDEDSDSDRLTNLQELRLLDAQSVPLYDFRVADTDSDGVLDGDEDIDDDGLTNTDEFTNEADPLRADSDSDRLPDGFEVHSSGTNPVLPDTDSSGVTDDREDPDADGLNNYQEYRLTTDPLTFTTLGSPSRLRSETAVTNNRAPADGIDTIIVMTTVRDAQGHFLPARPVAWTSSNPNLVFSPMSGETDEEGVATVYVSSTAVTSGVIEIRAADVVVGRPLVQFIGGDPAVRFTAYSATEILPGQIVNATFEVVNDGRLPIENIEVVVNLPFGLGIIETVTVPSDVMLSGQGSNAATWNIPALGVGERREFTLRYRSTSTLGLNTTIPLTVQTSAIEDTNAANNRASFSSRIVANFGFPAPDQQPEKLVVTVISDPTFAAVGQTIDLVITVENLSSEPLFNVSGFAPLLGTTYPNIAFRWNTPAQPGYLAPFGNGEASRVVARVPFIIPEGYPSGLNRSVVVQATDSDPRDGSMVVVSDSLTDAELGIRGPQVQASLTADRGSALDGETVTFTLTVTNSSAATDSAVGLQVTGNFFDSVQPLDDLPPGVSTTFQFSRPVTLADAPQITAQVLLTGQGAAQTDVFINRTLRSTVRVVGPTAPDSANLAFASSPTLVFLPGRTTTLPLTVVNNGTTTADAARLRLTVPFGIEPDLASLGSGSYDTTSRMITWELGTLPINSTSSVAPTFTTPSEAALGATFILDATLSTLWNETTLDDNMTSVSGVVALPAPTRVTVNSTPRNWLVADEQDQLTLTAAVFDQLGAPLANVTPFWSSSLPGVNFGAINPTNDGGVTTTTVRATQVGAVNVLASFNNEVYGATTINRRGSAVEIIRNPAAIGFGGSDTYRLFIVNTATLPDGITVSGDLIDLNITDLPPEVSFQFTPSPVPLGFGEFTETPFTVTIPPAESIEQCDTLQALIGTHSFTVTATGRTLGVIGQATGTLTISAAAQSVSDILPASGARIGGDSVLFTWRSNTPATSTVYYRRQGETNYTALPMTNDPTVDARVYRAVLDISAAPTDAQYEWYGEVAGHCGTYLIASLTAPHTFTHVVSTTFLDSGYDFTVADGYNLTTTVSGSRMTIRVRNDDSVPHSILLDVDNPYEDLILGFTESGSVDQVMLLQPGQTFEAPLRVFTQETERVEYSLSVRLENDRGDVDRVPLVIRVQQPRVELDLQVLSVDPRTLVTTARLTNLGDTLTDLSLDIVNGDGIPANFVIQPDIQHTYLLAGQSLEIAFIPLDVQDAGGTVANMSTQQFDPITNTTLKTTPTLLAIPGPYRVTASARQTVIPNVTLRDGTLSNTCGADDSDRTIAADCTTPAGSETRIVNDWYCTNRPNIDVPVSLALPNGGLGVPITNVSVGANFSPGGGAYTHSTTVAFNGTLIGSAVVPSQARIQGGVAPQALVLGGLSPTQILNLRSTHTNGTHYTVASGFTVTVDYEEHTRTGCFTQAEVDAAAGGELMCTPPSVLIVPEQELELNLTVDPSLQTRQNEDGAYVFRVGEQIPLIAQVSAAGLQNISDTVHIELTVPRGLVPQGMTIQGEDQSLLDSIFSDIAQFLSGLGQPFSQNFGNGFSATGNDQQVTFAYDYESDIVIGQPFSITLEVVGQVTGTISIAGVASLSEGQPGITALSAPDQAQTFAIPSITLFAAYDEVDVYLYQSRADFTNLDLTLGGEHQAGRAGLFWAIWNETSEDRQYSGHDATVVYTNLTNEEIEQRFRDDQARDASGFLAEEPYCNNGQNLADDEPPNNTNGWSSNVTTFDHCKDHRYLDANVILNGFLSYERRANFDPNDVDLTLGVIYGYLATNFQGTFNIGAAGRPLWAGIPQCSSTYISPYPATLASVDGERQYTYQNFDDLVNQIGRLYALSREIQQKRNDLRGLAETDTRYVELTNEINVLTTQRDQLPALFRVQGVAMRWISGYLDCLNAGSTSTISIKFPRIEAQIDRAIGNLYLEGDDPTNGAFNRRNPNRLGDSILLPISEPVDSIDRAIANRYYSDGETDAVADCGNYQSGVPDSVQYIDMLHSCYLPSNSTLVTPVLGIDVNASNSPVAFLWLGIAYQVEGGTPFSRYDYDICVDGYKCR